MTDQPDRFRLRTARTDELTAPELAAIRAIMDAAFADDVDGAFTDDDWAHALGGVHFVGELDGEIVAHASVVEREIQVGSRPLRAGYVEAVATAPTRQRQGWGSRVVRAATDYVVRDYEFGVLGTGVKAFYEAFGWRTWRGRSFVRTPGGDVPTPDEDGYIMVLRTPTTPPLDPRAPISCDWRPGDVW